MSPFLWSLLAGLIILVAMLYVEVFIPNFDDCRAEGKPIRMCLGYLVR